MNQPEREVATWLQSRGFHVLTRGWPDFIAVGPDQTVLFVEVKRNDQSQTGNFEQEYVLELLGRLYRQEIEASFAVIRPKDTDELDLRIRLCRADAKLSSLNSNPSSAARPN